MKKIYLIAAAVLSFAACSNENTVNEAIEDVNAPISFESFSEAITRAAENSTAEFNWVFYNHHSDFQVWGYKNTSNAQVFSGDKVTVAEATPATDPVTYTYKYSPIRFWDKAATSYEYYAAAPAGADWTFVATGITDATTQDKGYFTTTATIADHTLASSDYAQSFKSIASADAIDKMIASPCKVEAAAIQTGSTVQLHFNHIMSRLNVTIKKASGDALENMTVTMKNLQVARLNGNGNFSEATAAVATGTNTRWTDQSNPIVYTAVPNTEVTTDAKYVLQSLVVPQNAAFEGTIKLDGSNVDETTAPYLVITYNIKSDDPAYDEDYTQFYDLANLFQASPLPFNEGWQNTLNITIKPDVIEFCADVAEWATTLSKDVIFK